MSKSLRLSEKWFRFGLWLIAIVFARNREQDPSLRALAAEGRMYARSLQDGV